MNACLNAPTFELRNVSKTYGDLKVLDQLSVQFARGRRHALVGPNGSGKTTLLRLLAGRVMADSGEILCLGLGRLSGARSRPKMRYLTQHFSHYVELTIRENLEFVAAMHGVSAASREVNLALRDFDLLAHQNRRAQNLSGGMRQRLMLAAAFLGEPQTLLLDEPTAALDEDARRSFWQLLNRRRSPLITLILTTHLDEDVAQCDTVTRLRDGRIHSHVENGG